MPPEQTPARSSRGIAAINEKQDEAIQARDEIECSFMVRATFGKISGTEA